MPAAFSALLHAGFEGSKRQPSTKTITVNSFSSPAGVRVGHQVGLDTSAPRSSTGDTTLHRRRFLDRAAVTRRPSRVRQQRQPIPIPTPKPTAITNTTTTTSPPSLLPLRDRSRFSRHQRGGQYGGRGGGGRGPSRGQCRPCRDRVFAHGASPLSLGEPWRDAPRVEGVLAGEVAKLRRT